MPHSIKPGTTYRTQCGRGRIEYDPDWSKSQPWCSFWDGTAGPQFSLTSQAWHYFTDVKGARLIFPDDLINGAAKTVIDGAEVAVEIGGETTQCWITKGAYSANLEVLRQQGALSHDGHEMEVPEETIKKIEAWARAYGYDGFEKDHLDEGERS